jgi:hypothetical protein
MEEDESTKQNSVKKQDFCGYQAFPFREMEIWKIKRLTAEERRLGNRKRWQSFSSDDRGSGTARSLPAYLHARENACSFTAVGLTRFMSGDLRESAEILRDTLLSSGPYSN